MFRVGEEEDDRKDGSLWCLASRWLLLPFMPEIRVLKHKHDVRLPEMQTGWQLCW